MKKTTYSHWTMVLITILSLIIITCTDANSQIAGVWDDIAEQWREGDGTVDKPYLISTAAQLAYLSKQVRAGNEYEGKFFRLSMDIDMSNPVGKINFLPIGIFDAGTESVSGKFVNDSKPFEGTLNGGGHTIHHLYQKYENDVPGTITVGGHGLFGCIGSKGKVYNLHLASDCTLEGAESGGSICSILMGTLVDCSSRATVRGRAIMGGLVGSVLWGGIIDRCSFSGIVFGTMSVGGIVGTVDNTLGDAGAEKRTSIVTNSYANVEIVCTGFYPGGLIGMLYNGEISNSYATGIIRGDGTPDGEPVFTGGFTGGLDVKSMANKVTNCYYDGERFGQENDSNDGKITGVLRMTSEEMKTDAFVTQLGVEYKADKENTNEGYPVLTSATLGVSDVSGLSLVNIRVMGMSVFFDAEVSCLIYDLCGRLLSQWEDVRTVTLERCGFYVLVVNGRSFKVLI